MTLISAREPLTHELRRVLARRATARLGTRHHLKLCRRVRQLQRRLERVGG
ncbi:hypothetical protein [Deinococcus psychrotolerans]|uniref:hypothetical protein n=1 Tax=Deinococcus psychrotolerans TaxID=2489213 RepID=UPI0013DE0F51|nr:hypothetical protein [Deinococcus psychrotolerans]